MSRHKTRIRWEVEWQVLTEAAKLRHKADPNYEHDRDEDEETVRGIRHSYEEARAFAMSVDLTVTVYGHVTIQEQWCLPIEGTVHFDWEPVGDMEYVEQ